MKYLIGLFAIVFLSGCATWNHMEYNRGYNAGKKYCIKGRQKECAYYNGFYRGFLLQNFKSIDEDYSQ